VTEEDPWRRLDRRVAYDNPWLAVWHDDVIRPDGEPGIYGVVHFKNRAVGIVVLDDHDRTLLVGQHRYVLGRYSWEIPEGGAPLDEDPLVGAQRELREETGLEASRWERLLTAELSNSVSDEEAVAYLATGLAQGEAEPEGTEQLRLRWVTFDEAIAMIRGGEIRDALTILALHAVALRPRSPTDGDETLL
jgi:8-oxo-dGTP pyrophosphatase MutT (NUDIX family)